MTWQPLLPILRLTEIFTKKKLLQLKQSLSLRLIKRYPGYSHSQQECLQYNTMSTALNSSHDNLLCRHYWPKNPDYVSPEMNPLYWMPTQFCVAMNWIPCQLDSWALCITANCQSMAIFRCMTYKWSRLSFCLLKYTVWWGINKQAFDKYNTQRVD